MKKLIKMLAIFCAAAVVGLTGCSGTPNTKTTGLPQLQEVQEGEEIAIMKTSAGDITLRFFPEQAPKAVENFLTHAKEGYYDGVIFHRVINNFMIQGGDPLGTGIGGESIYGASFEDEFSEDLFNFRGALSMANAGADTNGSQFFIVQASSVDESMMQSLKDADYPEEAIKQYQENGGTPWLDQRHTVFGQVIEGMDVVDAIANTPVNAKDKPMEDIVIHSIEVTTYTKAADGQ